MTMMRMAAALLVGTSVPAAAQNNATAPGNAPGNTAASFGAREQVMQMSLSPDGSRLAAVVAMKGRGRQALVLSTAPVPTNKVLFTSTGNPEQIDYCSWATNSRLVCGISTSIGKRRDIVGFTRLVTINADGTDLKMLSARAPDNGLQTLQNGGAIIDWLADDAGAAGGALLMTRHFIPETSTGSIVVQTQSGLGVERVDPVTLRRTTVQMPRSEAREFITDGHGTIRVMGVRERDGSGYDAGRITYRYRKPGDDRWQTLSIVEGTSQTESGFNPYAVDRDLNVAYGFDNHDGRRALFKVALDGSLKKELVYARPDVDIAGLIRIGRQNRVVGVTFVTDRRQVDFFDPALKTLSAALGKAVPGLPLVTFVDANADESRLLLFAGSDVDPGQFMLFDKKTRHLSPLLNVRPELDGVKLSPTKAITYPASDGTPIPAYLTLPEGSDGKGLPAIVMPHGGPSDRDEWGFSWLVQFFAARGFAVIQPNFRGSTGYGEAWYKDNGFRSWQTSVGDVDDAGRWLVKQGIARPDRLGIVGWSYGGYAALQSGVLEPGLFKAIVAIAPVTDLETLRQEHSQFTDYKLVDAFIGKGDYIRAGWPAQNAGAIKVPVLMFHGDTDQNVGIGQSRLMASRLKAKGAKVTLVEFPGLDHQLDDSEARTTMLDKADAFLRGAMGM
ncbi:Dipeptidyl aminopeptidase/acylaminoacyl peptidase [Sphingomonas gellani]|uniref:Dipeptidyl aminopeptidase/acylaminoacyl peptidase n=1 Tax=Sphingomonas gellani TaxID=1166340 RepID=A0A1H8HB76_9SPHN|nr:S9 family peptidase [Sphingomonas gellani]SEN53486.1 Dipeptidyl aminopeptidase/acylaminoacyl peptidase [Sphingomonas gellani]